MGQFALSLRKALGCQGRILQAVFVVLFWRKSFAAQQILPAGFVLSLKKTQGQTLVEALLSVIAAFSFLWLLQGLYLQSQESIQKERLSSKASKKQAPWVQSKGFE